MHSNCIIWTVEVIGMEERGGKERRKDDEGGWLWSKGQSVVEDKGRPWRSQTSASKLSDTEERWC